MPQSAPISKILPGGKVHQHLPVLIDNAGRRPQTAHARPGEIPADNGNCGTNAPGSSVRVHPGKTINVGGV